MNNLLGWKLTQRTSSKGSNQWLGQDVVKVEPLVNSRTEQFSAFTHSLGHDTWQEDLLVLSQVHPQHWTWGGADALLTQWRQSSSAEELEKAEDHSKRNLTVSKRNKCRSPCQGHWYRAGTHWLRSRLAGNYLGITADAKFNISQQCVVLCKQGGRAAVLRGRQVDGHFYLALPGPGEAPLGNSSSVLPPASQVNQTQGSWGGFSRMQWGQWGALDRWPAGSMRKSWTCSLCWRGDWGQG